MMSGTASVLSTIAGFPPTMVYGATLSVNPNSVSDGHASDDNGMRTNPHLIFKHRIRCLSTAVTGNAIPLPQSNAVEQRDILTNSGTRGDH